MKVQHFLLLLLGLAFFATSCQDDDTTTPADNILKYDTGNVSGPLLDAGTHELAVRFPASKLTDHVGKKLTEIQVFVGNLPASLTVKLYGQGDAFTPGQLKYQGSVLGSTTVGEWNNYKVTPGFDITGEDIWIAVTIEHAVQMQSIGCDAGPRQANADWLYSDSDQAWLTYQERTGEAVNWNIRGKLE